jgi:Ca-activated chloride channel homolog
MVVLLITVGAALLAAIAELLHAHRVRRVARLAFGPSQRPARWARLAPVLRTGAVAALAWGLATLWQLPPRMHRGADEIPDHEKKHLLLVLDVSPSMRLVDAGPEGDQSRMARARDVLDSIVGRVGIRQYLVTVIAVYNGAIPVVEKSRDPEVLRNILNDLPMHYAFHKGDTDLFAGLELAADVAKPWRPHSGTLLLISDGDSVPATGMPKLPVSIASKLVIGVGDPREGTFIDGRHSRQEASFLRQIALRLGGVYHDGNTHHVASSVLESIAQRGEVRAIDRLTRREYALIACGAGAAVLAFLPLLLRNFGTTFRPGVRVDSDGDRLGLRGRMPGRHSGRKPVGIGADNRIPI